MIKNLDYKVKRNEDCVLIQVGDWISPSFLSFQKINGKKSITCFTRALASNLINRDFNIKDGSIIALTSAASDIAGMRGYEMGDGVKYFDTPISQIIGTIEGNEITLNNLRIAPTKILMRKINRSHSILIPADSQEMIGKIVLAGASSGLKAGEEVLIKDNVTTTLRLDGEDFFAADCSNVVGVIGEEIRFINESILMTSYVPNKLFSSSILVAPELNYEDLDYSDIYNRDLFKIKFLDESIRELSEGDIVLVNRDYTNYVWINDTKYFLINGKKYIEAKVL